MRESLPPRESVLIPSPFPMPARSSMRSLALVALALACGAAQAAAPLPPPALNPGLINKQGQSNLNQLEQQNALPKPSSPLQAPPPKPAPGGEQGPSFVLHGLRVDPTPFLSTAEIQAVASPYLGREVNIATLRGIVAQLNQVLARKHEVTVSAYLPPQTIAGGVVRIAVLQGRLGSLGVSGTHHLSPSFVRSFVALQPGEVVNLPRVSDDLARFNDTGLARIQALLRPGARFGLTDIELAVTEPPRNLLQVFLDNQGVSAVGRDEAGVLYQLYAPAGIDDKLTLYALKSRGNEMGSLAYNLPINASGGRAGISLSSGRIRDVSGIYQQLQVSGWSNSVSANLAQPVYVGSHWIFLGTGSLTWANAKSFELGTLVSSDSATVEAFGLKTGYTGPGLSAGATVTGSIVQSTSEVSGQRSDFDLLGGTFYARRALPRGLLGVASGAWQIASRQSIPGGELFQVGGPTTVRGYPGNAVAGPSGYFAQFELHHSFELPSATGPAGPVLDGFVFLDQGGVFNHYPRHQDLRSVGMGVTWPLSPRVSASFTLGVPLETTVYGQSGSEAYFSLTARLL